MLDGIKCREFEDRVNALGSWSYSLMCTRALFCIVEGALSCWRKVVPTISASFHEKWDTFHGKSRDFKCCLVMKSSMISTSPVHCFNIAADQCIAA